MILYPRAALVVAALALTVVTGCGPAAEKCSPTSCSGCCDQNGECQPGFVPQACGSNAGVCMACDANSTCQMGFCIPTGGGGGCKPASCASLEKNCGQVLDGCGGTLNCGACEISGETCGGGGTANVCGVGTCVPKTCGDLGANCGQVSDGCGGLLNCGTCTSPETCGGGGTANVCGQGACVPKTCAQLGKNCGTVSDGCGSQLECGACTSPLTCGGGGTPNVCGQGACVAKTCAQLGKDCGAVDDGCGNMQSCGTCSGFQTCGGGGTPNVCGATCAQTCPTGYTCNAQGVCAGGNAQNLVLNVPVPPEHAVSGSIQRNSATPTVSYCGYYSSDGNYYAAIIDFEHTTDGRYDRRIRVPCTSSTSSAWTFSGLLYPGTYEVTVSEYGDTNLPQWSTVVNSSFTVSGPTSNVVLNVPVPPEHTVSGSIQRNSVTPVVSYCGYYSSDGNYYAAIIDFDHTTDSRYDRRVRVPCTSSTSSAWTFSGLLYPGTYKVTVSEYGDTNLPEWSTVVNSSFTVSGPASNVVLNVPVPPEHTVSGSIQRNGVTPTVSYCGYYSSDGNYYAAIIDFDHTTDSRYDRRVRVPCTSSTASTWTFSGLLYPGTYKVTVSEYGDTNLPEWATVVNSSFTVSGAASNVVFNVTVPPEYTVSGSIQRNSATPTVSYCGYYSSDGNYYAATIDFDHTTDSRYDRRIRVPCASSTTSAWTFSGLLYPGTYKVTVTEYGDTNLPEWATVVNSSFTVSGPASNVVLNVTVPPEHTVSGSIQRNGVTPTVSYCGYYSSDGGYYAAIIDFDHTTDSRYDRRMRVPCTSSTASAWTFSGLLYPGTYKVTVSEYGDTNLPEWTTEVNSNFSVSGSASNVVFNVTVPAEHTVKGSIQRNSVTPTVSYCGYYSSDGSYYAAIIDFDHMTDSRYDRRIRVPCTSSTASTWTFSGLLYPGTYKVTVSEYGDTNLPQWSTTVVERLEVP